MSKYFSSFLYFHTQQLFHFKVPKTLVAAEDKLDSDNLTSLLSLSDITHKGMKEFWLIFQGVKGAKKPME